jgi:aldehyde dehydrogenase (NAD+)
VRDRPAAKVLTGGKVQGSAYEPTLLTDVPADVTLSREETFGPVATITIVDSADQAVDVANQTRSRTSRSTTSPRSRLAA